MNILNVTNSPIFIVTIWKHTSFPCFGSPNRIRFISENTTINGTKHQTGTSQTIPRWTLKNEEQNYINMYIRIKKTEGRTKNGHFSNGFIIWHSIETIYFLLLPANETKNDTNKLNKIHCNVANFSWKYLLCSWTAHSKQRYNNNVLTIHIDERLNNGTAIERVRALFVLFCFHFFFSFFFFEIFKINFQRLVICFAAFPCYFCCRCQFQIERKKDFFSIFLLSLLKIFVLFIFFVSSTLMWLLFPVSITILNCSFI